jgi:DNA-binding SARP family transcriptional activator/tetratricopeptide (TPR) repeat protein
VRFELLGPLRVAAAAGEVALTAARERVLLATLLLNANRSVPIETLVDAIWGEHPPRYARNQVQVCVSRLRRRMAEAGANEQVIATEPTGYRLDVADDYFDLTQFRLLVAHARTAATTGDLLRARDRYRAGLGLWRGPALTGLDSEPLRRSAAALEEERLRALHECIEAELACGGAGELVAELTDLAGHHPYQEGLHQALMLALFRAGRQADALTAYQRIRTLLIDDLGQEPGPALRELHQRILTGDATLLPTAPASPSPSRSNLPRAVSDFTGRSADLTHLLQIADRAGPGAPLVVAIDGMAGIGKTTLAVRAAHLLASCYPHAQLFIDLHGHSDHHPLPPATALDTLLRQLGVPPARIPTDLDERVTLWRSELTGRRVLIVLDNAASSDQVTPLLPATGRSLALVTSRRRLVGLEATKPVSLQLLTDQEGTDLLIHVAGERARHDPATALEVVHRCGNLPLAIRMAAARLAHRPGWHLYDLAHQLRGAGTLLDTLSSDRRTLADAFALSYHPLPPEQQRTFRLLGLHPGEHFDEHAAAALAGLTVAEARKTLEDLLDRHLVEQPHPGRYRLHDLIREYARHLAVTLDTDHERHTAVAGLLDYYLHATAAASEPWDSPHARVYLRLDEPLRPDLVQETGSQGGAWLESERLNLRAAVHHAAASGMDGYAWKLARAAWPFYYEGGHLDDLLDTHRCGLAAAERLGCDDAVATMNNYLASAYYKTGQFEQARSALQRAITIRDGQGDYRGVAGARLNLVKVLMDLGNLNESARLGEHVLAFRLQHDRLSAAASSFGNLGTTYMRGGRYTQTLSCHRRHLWLSHLDRDPVGVAKALCNIGATQARLGEHRQAIRLLTASLNLKRRAGTREGLGEVLNELGAVCRALGRYDEALARHREALDSMRDTGDRPGECMVRNDYGATLRATGDLTAALEQHRTAMASATRMKLKYEHARALDGIAACLQPTNPDAARQHWRRALTLYTEMGVPEQHHVTRKLAEIDHIAPSAHPAIE